MERSNGLPTSHGQCLVGNSGLFTTVVVSLGLCKDTNRRTRTKQNPMVPELSYQIDTWTVTWFPCVYYYNSTMSPSPVVSAVLSVQTSKLLST